MKSEVKGTATSKRLGNTALEYSLTQLSDIIVLSKHSEDVLPERSNCISCVPMCLLHAYLLRSESSTTRVYELQRKMWMYQMSSNLNVLAQLYCTLHRVWKKSTYLPQNSGREKEIIIWVLYWGPTSIRCHYTSKIFLSLYYVYCLCVNVW
jgi:hypothetical protein